jgi:hypothetical protein
MECLKNLVGLDGCTSGNEPYKLNQIGLSLGQLEKLLPDGYKNVPDWLEAIKDLAAQELSNDVINYVSSSVKVETLLENNVAGYYNERLKETTAPNYAGLYFDLWNRSAYAKLKISSIKFFGKHTGDVAVKIVNLLNGQEIDSVTIPAEADKVIEVPVDIEVKSKMRDLKVAVIYDASLITSYEATLVKSGCTNCGGSRGYRSSIASINPLNIVEPFIESNKTGRSDTAGLSIDYAWTCDQSEFVCSVSGSLGLPYLYRVGYNLIVSALNGFSQWSDQMTVNREQNEERSMFFEGRYASEMEKFLKNARVPKNVCFTCNPKVGILTRLPG